MASRKPENLDMFDLDIDKLSLDTVEQREAIIHRYKDNRNVLGRIAAYHYKRAH